MFQESDVGFVNCGMTFHELEGYPAPTGACGDLNLVADPRIACDLRWAGFDMTTVANNHTLDYGHAGLLATLRHLQKAGMMAAGAGANLAQARAPRYVDTPGGRLALVGCASTFRAGSEASVGHGEIPGRPGLSPLRLPRIYQVPTETLESLRETQKLLESAGPPPDARQVRFLGHTFREASQARVVLEADRRDRDAIVAEVARARAERIWCWSRSMRTNPAPIETSPPGFYSPSREPASTQAPTPSGHGPHVSRPIETYRGLPIFYSLDNLYFRRRLLPRSRRDLRYL